MLTQGAGQVDGAPRAVMWTISQIAARDGISKQAISAHVRRLLKSGLTVERDGHGKISAVNVAEFDHLGGKFRDPSKDQRPPAPAKSKSADQDDDESLNEATRQRAWLSAERERIALARDQKELISAAGEIDALVHAGADIAREIDRAVNWADELAVAVGKDGAHGARVALKRLLGGMRTRIADVLAKVAAAAPEVDMANVPAAEPAEPVS